MTSETANAKVAKGTKVRKGFFGMTELRLNQVAKTVLDCSFKVHTALGPGLLESRYKACLSFEVAQAGLKVQLEVPVPLHYAGQKLADVGCRIHVLVEDELVVEIKSVDAIIPVHKSAASFLSATVPQEAGFIDQLQ